jgi:DNA-binding NarL/FixJ family response regulator
MRAHTAPQDPAPAPQAMRTETPELASQHETTFTPREIEVLHRLRQGLQNKIIAYELGMSESTVKVHLRNVMKKLNASNRTQVAFMLRRQPHLTSNGAGAQEHAPQ